MGRKGKIYFSPSFFGICIEVDWLKIQKNSRSFSPPGREGGPLIKVLYWEAPPRGPTPHPFINHFRHKRYPFVYLMSDKWYSFQNFASLQTSVNALSVKYIVNHKAVSLRSKRFQSSYCAKVRAEAKSFFPLPLPRHFFFCSCPNFLDEPREETLATQLTKQ